MAPLIDIVFQLLIFFMLTSAFTNPAMKLDLPKASTKDDNKTEQIVISISQTGKIMLNTTPVTLETLGYSLSALLKNEPSKAIHLQGEAQMPYEYFVQVMDIARQTGAKQILIVHEDIKKS